MYAVAKKLKKYNENTKNNTPGKKLKWSLLGDVWECDSNNQSCATAAQTLLSYGGLEDLLKEDKWPVWARLLLVISVAGLSSTPWLLWDHADDGKMNQPLRDILASLGTFLVTGSLGFFLVVRKGLYSSYSVLTSKIVAPRDVIKLIKKAKKIERDRYDIVIASQADEEKAGDPVLSMALAPKANANIEMQLISKRESAEAVEQSMQSSQRRKCCCEIL